MSFAGPVLLAGATGLVGREVLSQLLAAVDGPEIVAPVRRLPSIAHPRLTLLQTDFAPAEGADPLAARIEAAAPRLAAYVCCLGTTIAAAGSREAFVAIDRDLVLRLAAIARGLGARQAVLVSSIGASAQSGNFYLRVKGEAERGLAALGFVRVDLLRPGLLLGDRDRDQSRPVERLARRLAPAFNPLLPGRLRRYRAIPAAMVAAAAVAVLREPAGGGPQVHGFDSLERLATG